MVAVFIWFSSSRQNYISMRQIIDERDYREYIRWRQLAKQVLKVRCLNNYWKGGGNKNEIIYAPYS